MTLYRNTTTGEIRDLDDSLIAAWQAAGNPKTGQWEAYSPPPPPPPEPPSPDWTGFLSQLLLSPDLAGAQLQAQQMIAEELQTAEGERQQQLLTAYTALNSLPAVLAAAAPTGGPGLFVDAWSALRQAQLVSPQVAGALTELAQAHHLPADLIDALGAEP
jgi:hypothetical protein